MNVTFGVITKIPDSLTEGGNLALPDELFLQTEQPNASNDFAGKHRAFGESREEVMFLLSLRHRVFNVGEILILDGSSGREIGYPGRKPSKWDVECEEFDSLDDAIRRALLVLDKT